MWDEAEGRHSGACFSEQGWCAGLNGCNLVKGLEGMKGKALDL